MSKIDHKKKSSNKINAALIPISIYTTTDFPEKSTLHRLLFLLCLPGTASQTTTTRWVTNGL